MTDSPLPLIGRRRALGLLGTGVVALAGCGRGLGDDTTGATSTTSTSTTDGAAASSTTGADGTGASAGCTPIPDETAGPYPGDGSNGPDVRTMDGVVRQDIRTSVGSASGTAEGVPLTIDLTVLDAASGCAPLPGAAVYLWHCDRDGGYSMYSSGIEDETYLRGVQVADDAGALRFASIFPGAYDGRWPHVHFEVYPSVEAATSGTGEILVTSQLALPDDVCDVVYATTGYEASARNIDRTSLDADMVFADGHDQQLATVTATVADGLVASLTLAV
jgi:protocatechuate 3,4-dioxygenase beta subunit